MQAGYASRNEKHGPSAHAEAGNKRRYVRVKRHVCRLEESETRTAISIVVQGDAVAFQHFLWRIHKPLQAI